MRERYALCRKGLAAIFCVMMLVFFQSPSLVLASEAKPGPGLPTTISIGSLAPGTAAHA